MEKQKRWHTLLILGVVLLTVYNILPTLFFYTKPLNAPINEAKAEVIAKEISERINALEQESIDWVYSYCNLLKIKPESVAIDANSPQWIHAKFSSTKEAREFKNRFNTAGNLIPFYPAQLSLLESEEDREVTIQRKIPLQIDLQRTNEYFTFVRKWSDAGIATPEYRALVTDRFAELGCAVGGNSDASQTLSLALTATDGRSDELLYYFIQNLIDYKNAFGETSPISKRFFASITQGPIGNKTDFVNSLIQNLTNYKDRVQAEKIKIQDLEKTLQNQDDSLSLADQEKLIQLVAKEQKILDALYLVKNQSRDFSIGQEPFNYTSIKKIVETNDTLMVGKNNPLIQSIQLDLTNELITLVLHSDLELLLKGVDEGAKKELINQILFREISAIQRKTLETIKPEPSSFQIMLSSLPQSSSLLTANLSKVAKAELDVVKSLLNHWMPKTEDLQNSYYPITDYETFTALPNQEKHLQLVLYAPALQDGTPLTGFRSQSIYVIAKDLQKIMRKFGNQQSEEAKAFLDDFYKLRKLLASRGFTVYPGTTYPLSSEYQDDFIFEIEDYYLPYLRASYEDFAVLGSKKFATLEFSDVKQRILTENKIETLEQENLLRWRDDYNTAQVSRSQETYYDVPKPTKSPLWNNLKISFHKYFRGDDRKILKWGLDLSGGKTVEIQLRDSSGKIVSGEDELRQGVNELYNRVNKMGVSEVNIRTEGTNIAIDFPGSQGISAAELIKASSMTFHVVNEKFSPYNRTLADSINRFLQEVWDEAVVTGKKDIEDINRIAWTNLYGDASNTDAIHPRTESATILYQAGLRLANPLEGSQSGFNDSVSKIGRYRGDSFSSWYGQDHPLIFIFNNYAIEGSSLDTVRASYDPKQGNYLSFSVKSSKTLPNKTTVSPTKELAAWTSVFAQEKVMGTDLEEFSPGRGWRMAIVLNGSIISAPPLSAEISDNAMITGNFSQREVNQLAADLKAGSLSFSPQILSEKNVSPDLGMRERHQGIMAASLAFLFVLAIMIGYYRFAGLVASIAVLFNLLIMWAVLQNIGASLTLAGIAGVILTIGMAVDANVLVFERIREEYEKSARLVSAIQAGYKRAFSAILDSNITTLLAAIILLNFDSGPVKGFAVTLIIGIVSSMFTALFVTKTFFTRWVQSSSNKRLTMCSFIKGGHFPFLSYSRIVALVSFVIVVAGGFLFVNHRHTFFGMDFTGGYAVTLELPPGGNDYRKIVEEALEKGGLKPSEFQVRELSPNNHIRLFLSKSLNEEGKPFYQLPVSQIIENQVYSYESNPRLVWVIDTLQKNNVALNEKALDEVGMSFRSVSGQLSDSMRENAIFGLMIALISILVYITFRFEFKYAISATLGLAYDLIITLAILAILNALHVPIQFDLNAVAALMTIVGYSLNDTIIVFDRVREDLKGKGGRVRFDEVINRALNTTLSRTVLTSSTTLIVLIALVIFGGSSIFGFSLLMTIGVVVGTLSSFFISSVLLFLFDKREQYKHKQLEEKKS